MSRVPGSSVRGPRLGRAGTELLGGAGGSKARERCQPRPVSLLPPVGADASPRARDQHLRELGPPPGSGARRGAEEAGASPLLPRWVRRPAGTTGPRRGLRRGQGRLPRVGLLEARSGPAGGAASDGHPRPPPRAHPVPAALPAGPGLGPGPARAPRPVTPVPVVTAAGPAPPAGAPGPAGSADTGHVAAPVSSRRAGRQNDGALSLWRPALGAGGREGRGRAVPLDRQRPAPIAARDRRACDDRSR